MSQTVSLQKIFLDSSLESIRQESKDLFAKVGSVILIGEVNPKNQLRGYFIIKAERGELQFNFALTPENPSLIQQYQIKEVK